MRKVFHGGIEIIEHPLVHVGRDNLDFGKGFYVTDILKHHSSHQEWMDIVRQKFILLDKDSFLGFRISVF